jgi:hypothetical protein
MPVLAQSSEVILHNLFLLFLGMLQELRLDSRYLIIKIGGEDTI